ncbi:cupin domain-containing protein [Streptosporangium saharense]|uniref:cupin domain-containing protein n=1 Tax=Streptosporangium saharense TaxID=1706840 RepID=UPI0034314D86
MTDHDREHVETDEGATMSYPDPKYLGETGEVSAVYRSASTPPELVRSPVSAAYLATGASTNGQFGLYRWNMGPEPSGPSPHFHRGISESFFILSGTVRLYDGERWTEATSGDFLYVPEGGVHAFRNESGEDASMLILFAPGAPREPYFEDLPTLAGMSEEERAEFYLRHDTFWV